MGMREDVLELKKELNEVKEQSLAMEMYKDSKRANKHICLAFTSIIVVMSILWFLTGVYLVKVLNDTKTVSITKENTQKISDIDTMNKSNIVNGDLDGNNKANK